MRRKQERFNDAPNNESKFRGGAAAWPFAAQAQQSAMPVVGYLSTGTAQTDAEPYLIPFRQGLNTLGYTEDRNVAIEYRWAEFRNERLQELAADLIRRSVNDIANRWHAASTCG